MEAVVESQRARMAALEDLVERQRHEWQAVVAELRMELDIQRQLTAELRQKEEDALKMKEEEKEEASWKKKARGTMTRLGRQLTELQEEREGEKKISLERKFSGKTKEG
ncbi:uncharacterized protein LOC143831145 [Paroedura picta]|uniref:uncharacterized protein LOC143831145 n=1 Tax=Paroedura picta TaxID=143630 RepID=UPI004056BDD3